MADSSGSPLRPRLPNVLSADVPLSELHNGEWTRLELRGDLREYVGHSLEVVECRLANAQLTGADLEAVRMADVLVEDCELSGVVFADASFTRVEFRNCRMSAVQLPAARLRHVRFADCQLEAANFRMVKTERLELVGTLLSDADFYDAKLKRAHFFHCDLAGADFSAADVDGALLQGSNLEGVRGSSYLKGVTIDASQIVPLGLSILATMGVRIDEDGSHR